MGVTFFRSEGMSPCIFKCFDCFVLYMVSDLMYGWVFGLGLTPLQCVMPGEALS